MKAKIKNLLLAIIVSVVAIFIPSFLLNKWVEGIFFFICHWLIRYQFPKQYHHVVPSMGRLITSIVFFFGVSFIFPFGLSLLSAIPITYFISWVGFTKKQADYYETKYLRLKEELESKETFCVDDCTEEQLRKRCKELNFTPENTEIAIDLFVKKVKQSEMADKLFVNEKTIQQFKWRMKKKLTK